METIIPSRSLSKTSVPITPLARYCEFSLRFLESSFGMIDDQMTRGPGIPELGGSHIYAFSGLRAVNDRSHYHTQWRFLF